MEQISCRKFKKYFNRRMKYVRKLGFQFQYKGMWNTYYLVRLQPNRYNHILYLSDYEIFTNSNIMTLSDTLDVNFIITYTDMEIKQ